MNDSSAGRVEFFMLNEVPRITSFVMDFRIGYISGSSKKTKKYICVQTHCIVSFKRVGLAPWRAGLFINELCDNG